MRDGNMHILRDNFSSCLRSKLELNGMNDSECQIIVNISFLLTLTNGLQIHFITIENELLNTHNKSVL